MPIVVNTNSAATSASFNLSRSNEALRKSLGRLSSGKRITSPADDAGGLAVAYKLASKTNRTEAVIQNSQNALSYLQVQDASLQTVGKILDRMAELRTMAQDVTKNSGDIENYSKEFVELQSQLRKSIVFITHDLEEAVKIGDRIAIMRDGKFIQVGTPKEIIMEPKEEFVQAFTKGVDRGLVVDVESISVKTNRTIGSDSSLQDTSALMDSLFAERLYVLGAGGSYKGVISRDKIQSSLADGSTNTLEDIIESYEPIMGTNSVGELLPLLADQDFALPVVDENQIMNGIVRHKDVFAFMVESAKAQKEVDVDIQT